MLVEWLKQDYLRRSKVNPRYSLRSYAQALGLNSGTLSQIMSGKRPLSTRSTLQILKRLPVDAQFKGRMLTELLGGDNKEKSSSFEPFSPLKDEVFELIRSWEHFAILSLVRTRSFVPRVDAVAKRLGLPYARTLEAVERLERLGFLRVEKTAWTLLKKDMSVLPQAPNRAVRELNRQMIYKAYRSLSSADWEDRDVSGTTLSISKSRLPEARKLIQEFRQKLCRFLEQGEPDEVYRLNVQLFPLSQVKKKESRK